MASKSNLAVSLILTIDAVVLMIGGVLEGRWQPLAWMLLSVAGGLLTPVVNAGKSAALLGRIILVIAAVLFAYYAAEQVAMWMTA